MECDCDRFDLIRIIIKTIIAYSIAVMCVAVCHILALLQKKKTHTAHFLNLPEAVCGRRDPEYSLLAYEINKEVT